MSKSASNPFAGKKFKKLQEEGPGKPDSSKLADECAKCRKARGKCKC